MDLGRLYGSYDGGRYPAPSRPLLREPDAYEEGERLREEAPEREEVAA